MIQDKWDLKSEEVPAVGGWKGMKEGTSSAGTCFPQCLLQQATTGTCHQMSRDPKLARPGEVLLSPPGAFSLWAQSTSLKYKDFSLRVLVPLTEYDY